MSHVAAGLGPSAWCPELAGFARKCSLHNALISFVGVHLLADDIHRALAKRAKDRAGIYACVSIFKSGNPFFQFINSLGQIAQRFPKRYLFEELHHV